jgi:hypothetical protein
MHNQTLDPKRISFTAAQVAQAKGLTDPALVDQITGMIVRKMADGLTQIQAWDAAKCLAADLASQQRGKSGFQQLIDDIVIMHRYG